FWLQLRTSNGEVPGGHRLLASDQVGRDLGPTAKEALALYLRVKGGGRSATFATAATRAIDYLVASKKNKRLLAYTKTDATSFRDELCSRGLSGSSVVRIFSSLRSVTSFALSEHGLSVPSPFTGIFLNRTVSGPSRTSIPVPEIRAVQDACRLIDDDIRWLVALISDTGMRLAEAAGLATADILLETSIPHLVVQPHPWRSLKTVGSARFIPLVGHSLWAAERIVASKSGAFSFPRYTKDGRTNANSASAALNKWLAPQVSEGCVIHSFRHSLRDRLRAVECPSDVADQLGGWATSGDGQGYGSGYSLDVLAKWMIAIQLETCSA
ncbi:MAG: tyrosine-type recombinase/integrase, partial [Fimbriimonadaceae bacterium]